MSIPESTAITIFWISLIGIFLTYSGTSLMLKIVGLFKKALPNEDDSLIPDEEFPTVEIIIPARNEAANIAARLENLLAQEFPPGKLTVIVGSDCSTDDTAEIVKRYADRGVQLVEMPHRSGKFGIIDYLVPRSEAEIIVITDANVKFRPAALRRLITPYRDPKVGGTGGTINMVPPGENERMQGEATYRDFETRLKTQMDRFGFLIGSYGGFYSFRKQLFRTLGNNANEDDIILPLEVLSQGFHYRFMRESQAIEVASPNIYHEFRRRVRMTAFHFRSLNRSIRLACNAGWLVLLTFLSYKVLRWISPILFALLFLSSALLFNSNWFFKGLTAFFSLGIVAAIIGWIADQRNLNLKLFISAYHFAMMNIAGVWGLLCLFKSKKRFWEPRS